MFSKFSGGTLSPDFNLELPFNNRAIAGDNSGNIYLAVGSFVDRGVQLVSVDSCGRRSWANAVWPQPAAVFTYPAAPLIAVA